MAKRLAHTIFSSNAVSLKPTISVFGNISIKKLHTNEVSILNSESALNTLKIASLSK